MSFIPFLYIFFACSDFSGVQLNIMNIENVMTRTHFVRTQLAKLDIIMDKVHGKTVLMYEGQTFEDPDLFFDNEVEAPSQTELYEHLDSIAGQSLRAERIDEDTLRAERVEDDYTIVALYDLPDSPYWHDSETPILGTLDESISTSLLMAQLLILGDEGIDGIYIPLRAERFSPLLLDVIEYTATQGVDSFDVFGNVI